MICTVAMRRLPQQGEEDCSLRLRITSRLAKTGSGLVLSDEVQYPTRSALVQALRKLQLPENVLGTANTTSEAELAEQRWIHLGADLQIPEAVLAAADFHLNADE